MRPAKAKPRPYWAVVCRGTTLFSWARLRHARIDANAYSPSVRLAYLLAGLGLLAAGGCFEDTAPVTTSGNDPGSTGTSGVCDQGSLGCACFPNGTCSPGLVCAQGVCDPFDDSGTTTSTTATTPGMDDTTTSSTTRAVDSTSSDGGEMSTSSGGESSSSDEGSSSDSTDGGSTDEESSSSTGGGPAHILFTTSMDWSAVELGSLAGADVFCEQLGMGLRNVPWVAVLSDAGTPLADRIEVVGEVVNTIGETLALDEAEVLSGTLQALPGYDEAGNPISGSDLAWTGSMTNDCNGWTSDEVAVTGTVGLPTSDSLWLDTTVPLPCTAAPHLYCISQ